MKYSLSFFLLCGWLFSSAQIKSPVGSYHVNRNHDPQGGSNFFLLANNKYVVVFFGGAQTGVWKMEKDSLIKFTPEVNDQAFKLYGRKNEDLGDSLKVFFNNFEERQTFISVNPASHQKTSMRRVYNKDPNCFTFPYVYKFKTAGDSLSFSHQLAERVQKDSLLHQIFTFKNKDKYNDFVAYYFPLKYHDRPYFAKMSKQGLIFNDDNYVKRQDLPTAGEDLKFIQGIVDADKKPQLVFYNPYYGSPEKDLSKDRNYSYNEKKGAYINILNYKEGQENKEEEDSFNNMNLVYPFKLIADFSIAEKTIIVVEKPLFNVTCRSVEN